MKLITRSVAGLYLLSLALWIFIFQGRLPGYVDTALYAYPDHGVNLASFHQGFLPLWNPWVGCGTPHLANWQSACFYPPFWLFNLTGMADGFMAVTLAHSALAFFGFYLWLRSQKIEPLFCALAALSFAGSAHLVRCWTNIPFLATAAWVPWIFWAARRALGSPSRLNGLLLALFLSLQVLAGYPFFTFYTVLFLVLWFEFQKPEGETRRFFWLILGAAALATCLQWLPFLDFLSFSNHDVWKDYPYFTKPVEYLTLLKADILGDPMAAGYRGTFANQNFNLYFGLIPLGILLARLIFLRRSKEKFWPLAALASLLWLAGSHFFLWRVIPQGWLEWVEPSKATVLFLFCALTAVAGGLASFHLKHPKLQLPWAWLLALLWMGDLFGIPFQLIHPLENPFEKTALRRDAEQVKSLAGEGRTLSLQSPEEMNYSGPTASRDAFEQPVNRFLANSNAVWGIRSADKYLFLRVEGSENLMKYINRGFPYKGDLLDVAGVRLFLLPQSLESSKYQALGKVEGRFLSLNRQASSNLRFVAGKEDFPDRSSLLNQLARPRNPWREKIFLERNSGGTFAGLGAPPGDRPKAPLDQLSSSRTSLEGSFPGPGFVAYNETYAPGWRAWVDGVGRPILRAYGLFMGVAVTAGKHQVDFRYEPASFRLGLFLSLLTLAALLGVGLQAKV